MTTTTNSLRGKVAIAGIGETQYYKHGQSPDAEFKLALQAILNACADAGVDPHDIDGFSSYSNDRNEPARLASALGARQFRSSTMQWGGGGGGCCASIANGAAMITAGLATHVVAFRALAQGEFGRFGQSQAGSTVSGDVALTAPYGVLSPAQKLAMRVRRYMHDYDVHQDALRSIALTSYNHAQKNERAIMYGRPLSIEKYEASRWIVEPFHLFDCCMENDGAAAMLLVAAERARDLRRKPVFIMGAAIGSDFRSAATAHNAPNYATANFSTLAKDLYAMAGISANDVGSVQCYENFTGGVMMALTEHDFFKPEESNVFLTVENLSAPSGKLPLNTSGGNLAECYMHGMELVIEAARQIRGESCNQADRSDVSLVIGGPLVTPVSDLLVCSEAAL